MSEFNSELYMVKGIFEQDEKEPTVKGYYWQDEYKRSFIMCDGKNYETNPYTLCKNTGAKVGNDYLYAYDVIQFSTPMMNDIRYGYVEYCELRNAYVIVTGIEQRSKRELGKCCNIKLTGKNIILSDNDYKWFADWEMEEHEKNKGHVIDNSYCPSKFKR